MVGAKSAAQLDLEIAEYLASKARRDGKGPRAKKAPRLPRYDERTGGWRGGDSRTLYAFTVHRTGRTFVRPGGQVVNMGPEVTVRIATREEAEDLWQKPLHVGWNVA